jgi:hypothetical protein
MQNAEVSFEQAIASARRAGNTREEARNVDYLAASAVWGPSRYGKESAAVNRSLRTGRVILLAWRGS